MTRTIWNCGRRLGFVTLMGDTVYATTLANEDRRFATEDDAAHWLIAQAPAKAEETVSIWELDL